MGFCLLLQIRVSDGSVADTYMIQDDFVHLNHSNAPHLYEDRLVILGVSHLQHKSWGASPSDASTLFVRSTPASVTGPPAEAARGAAVISVCVMYMTANALTHKTKSSTC